MQVGTSVVLYDATGAKTRARRLAPGEARPPVLLDVQGDLAAYASGGAIHLLRLSDGRDLSLVICGHKVRRSGAGVEPTEPWVTRPHWF